MNTSKKVAIIGAGPSGLVMAKTLLHHYPKGSFEPIIFDSKPTVGGIWAVTRPGGGTTPKTGSSDFVDCFMRTNLSRYTVSFSDHDWNDERPDGEDIFPQAWKVGEYLKSYAERFLPRETLRLSCRVTRTQRDSNDTSAVKKWTVEWSDLDQGKHSSDAFDYLVVASGYFSRPYIPSIPGLNHFPKDRIMHSSSLRSNSQIPTSFGEADGKILIVGGSMSGAEAAASTALNLSSTNSRALQVNNGPKIYHITTRPFWAVPTYLPSNDQPGSFLPLDIVMYDLSRRPPGDVHYALGPVTTDRANIVHAYFESLIGSDQSDFAEGLLALRTNSADRNNAPWVAVTDHYPGFVRCGDIVPTLGRVSGLHWTSTDAGIVEITQDDGKTVKLDHVAAIVFATGFTPFESLSFLPDEILQSLEYTEDDTVFPIVLDEKGVRNPDIPDLGFVGMYRGPYWGVMEMQARSLARQWSSGQAEDSNMDTTKIKDLRTASSRAQFPMGDYVGMMETFAREMHIPRKPIQENATERTGPVIPARYFGSTNTDENSSSNKNMIVSLQKLLLDPNESSSNHTEQQRALCKTVLRALHGHWQYERDISPATKTITGQTLIRLQKSSYNDAYGTRTEFVMYEEDPKTEVTFRVSDDDGHIYTTRQDAPSGRFKFVHVEKIDGDDSGTQNQNRHFAHELDTVCSEITRKYVFNMRGVTITSWEVEVEDKQNNTAIITKYRR